MLKTPVLTDCVWKAFIVTTLFVGGVYLLLAAFSMRAEITFQVKNPSEDSSHSEYEIAATNLGNIGTFPKWSKVEIEFTGPDSVGMGTPNPFQIAVEVTFNGPGGETFVVPAFYDGDGAGGLDGNVWKVRFSPNAVGMWSFTSASSEGLLNGHTGTFEVTEPTGCQPYTPSSLPDFSCVGRLEYTGDHHLKFAKGPYWLKGGIDDPENFIGTAFGDWDAKKAAVVYLSSRQVNSLYIITNNIHPGDRDDTWPWVGDTSSEAKANSDRFNVAKLQEWEDFFAYVQNKGLVLHIILDDDSAWHNYDHALYYREMIARFGHHPGLIWNIGEEANENYSNSEQIMWAAMLRTLDPYNHPVTVHRKPVWPFFGDPNFDLTSIQSGNGATDFTTATLDDFNATVINHRQLSVTAGRPIPIMIDEMPRVSVVNSAIRSKMRLQVIYPIFLAGGNYEMHYYDAYGQGGQVTIQDLEPMLDDMHRARQFVEALPFHEMEPCNQLLSDAQNYCFAKLGTVYAVYLPNGGSVEVDLSAATGNLPVVWFNPRTGAYVGQSTTPGGGQQTFTPPFTGDAALTIGLINADLSLDKSVITGTQLITYTLTFSNHGPHIATGVVVSDSLPIEIGEPITVSSNMALTRTPGTTFTWSILDDLNVDEQGTITISGRYSNTATITNTASITSEAVDNDLSNNMATIRSDGTDPSSPTISLYLPTLLKES